MATTITPASRFGWTGQTVEYEVHADGASEIVAPTNDHEGLRVRVVSTKQVAGGVDAVVQVDVADGALY